MTREKTQGCMLCPRRCNADRAAGEKGFCGGGTLPVLARAALHFWEEPCISGESGSGAVFFSGCNLGCVFCQNHRISRMRDGELFGRSVSPERLCEIFYELKEQGAANINLVTGDIYIPALADAIGRAKRQGFSLPFVFNSSAYLEKEALHMLEGRIDVYLPDMKFYSKKRAERYCHAADYPEKAAAAIREMFRQTGECRFDEKGMIKKGLILRHLLLPGGLLEAKLILKKAYREYGDAVYFSLLNQYTPMQGQLTAFPELQERVPGREYDELVEYALSLGIHNAWIQEDSSGEDYIPEFDMTGVLCPETQVS
ncbi:MAG: radical SAM protein [Lachnospiraceae bacterium]|nr:radical SAM protein [Lachnospiraceae bacterium]